MPELPPISSVKLTVRCRSCDQLFRGMVSWLPDRPAYTRMSCAWCGSSQLVHRTGRELRR